MVSDLFKISRVAFQASFLTGIWPLISPIAILSLTASCTFGYQEPPEEVGLDDSQVGAEVRIYGENPATWSPTGGEIYDYDSDSWIPTIQSDQPIVLEDSDGIHWRVELNGRPIEGRFERPVSPQQPLPIPSSDRFPTTGRDLRMPPAPVGSAIDRKADPGIPSQGQKRTSIKRDVPAIGIQLELDPSTYPRITQLNPRSLAAEAGLELGDQIVSIDDQAASRAIGLLDGFGNPELRLRVLRSGKFKRFLLAPRWVPNFGYFGGIQLGLLSNQDGLRVVHSDVANGLTRGDVIYSVGDQPVRSIQQLMDACSKSGEWQKLDFVVQEAKNDMQPLWPPKILPQQ